MFFQPSQLRQSSAPIPWPCTTASMFSPSSHFLPRFHLLLSWALPCDWLGKKCVLGAWVLPPVRCLPSLCSCHVPCKQLPPLSCLHVANLMTLEVCSNLNYSVCMKADRVDFKLGEDRSWLSHQVKETGTIIHTSHIVWGLQFPSACPSPAGTLLVVYRRLTGHPFLVAFFGPPLADGFIWLPRWSLMTSEILLLPKRDFVLQKE